MNPPGSTGRAHNGPQILSWIWEKEPRDRGTQGHKRRNGKGMRKEEGGEKDAKGQGGGEGLTDTSFAHFQPWLADTVCGVHVCLPTLNL